MVFEPSEELEYEHRRIEYWAYRFWQERGSPIGSPNEDWFRAEREYLEQNPTQSLPFIGLGPGEL